MHMIVEPTEFKKKFEEFKKTKFDGFGDFWEWKLKTETKSEHILDANHIDDAFKKLIKLLREWKWHRPHSYQGLEEKLENALRKISDAYDQIRDYSLLQFEDVPEEPLKLIWRELGQVKLGKESSGDYCLVMSVTKPLMVLWGQTLSFDSRVRSKMPKFEIEGLNYLYWDFATWKKVMAKFQKSLSNQYEIVSFFRELSFKTYGTDKLVPYGQFLDLYYWYERS